MQRRAVFKNSKGQTLVGILHMPKKTPAPGVIVCHGFTSSKYTKREMCDFFAKNGFLALRFDFNGHGESYGSFRDMTITKCVSDLQAAVKFIKRQKEFNGKLGITGTSMGGQVIMVYAAGNSVDALIPVCPAFNWERESIMEDSKIIEEWKKNGTRYFCVRIKKGSKKENKPLSYGFVLDCCKYDMKYLTRKVKSSVLLIHGDKDKSVPLSHSEMYYKNLGKPKKLVVIKGAGHNHEFRKKDLKILYEESLEWFNKYLKAKK